MQLRKCPSVASIRIGGGEATMRLMFVLYIVVIIGVISGCLVIGLWAS
jgi:hypothetical protein